MSESGNVILYREIVIVKKKKLDLDEKFDFDDSNEALQINGPNNKTLNHSS